MGACMRSLTCSFIRSTAYYVLHYVSYYVPDTNRRGCLLCTLEGLTGRMACPLLKVKPEEAQEGLRKVSRGPQVFVE